MKYGGPAHKDVIIMSLALEGVNFTFPTTEAFLYIQAYV